jgi:hypothetical protein
MEGKEKKKKKKKETCVGFCNELNDTRMDGVKLRGNTLSSQGPY